MTDANRHPAFLRLSILFFATAALACAVLPPDVQAMRLVAVTISRGVGGDGTVPVNIVDTFSPDAPEIHLVAVIEGAGEKTPIRASWISVDAIETPDYEIDSRESVIESADDARAHFKLTRPTKGWPVGNYRGDLYAMGKFLTSVPFSIRPAGAGSPPRPSAGKAPKSPPPDPGSALLGRWVHEEGGEPISLDFVSRNRLVSDGEAYEYSVRPGEVVVRYEEGPVAYPYVLDGQTLDVVFPDGERRRFRRAQAAVRAAADDSDAVAFFRGCYFQDIRSSGETKLYLYADGTFFDHSDSAYGGNFTDSGGNQTGAWGTASASQNRGTWSLRGKKDTGVFLLKDRNGSVREVRYQVFVEKGKPFWGEFKINGVHMIKNRIE